MYAHKMASMFRYIGDMETIFSRISTFTVRGTELLMSTIYPQFQYVVCTKISHLGKSERI